MIVYDQKVSKMDKMSYNVMWVVLGAVAMTALLMSPVIGSN